MQTYVFRTKSGKTGTISAKDFLGALEGLSHDSRLEYDELVWLGEQHTPVYPLTVVQLNKQGKVAHQRSWAVFTSFEEAEKALREEPDLYLESGSYTHVVIEELPLDALSISTNVHWLHAAYDEAKDSYTIAACECPEDAKQVVNWAIG